MINRTFTKLFGTSAPAKSTMKSWYISFRKGDVTIEECRRDDRSDHEEKTKKIESVRNALVDWRHWCVCSLSTHVGIPSTSVYRILTDDLRMVKKLGKWMPHKLTPDQQE